jgi:FAD/FMN-containing dehydrogenase
MLFVGSEGTLGVLTEATLGIKAPPKWRLLFIVESTQEDLDATVQTFRDQGPTAVELVDKSVFRKMNRWDEISKYSRSESPNLIFCEFDGSAGDSLARAEELSRSRVSRYDPIVLTGPAEIQEAWEARNETLRLAQDFRKGSKILVPGVEDLVVHPSRLGDLVKILVGQYERRGMEFIMYGHAGDANLHTRPLLDLSDSKDQRAFEEITDELFEAVWKMKGSITGEHGDGMLRAKYVHKQYPRTYWIMKELKDLYDPKKLLNPGVKVV